MTSRLQRTARLLYKDVRVKVPGSVTKFERRGKHTKARGKVQTDVTVENMELHAAHENQILDAKEHGTFRYPGGIIQRHADTVIDGVTYHDPKCPGMPRKKIESNFLITLNTNRTMTGVSPLGIQCAKDAMELVLRQLSEDNHLAIYLKFGPKDEAYRDDRYKDVVSSVEWQAAVECGSLQNRLHTHIWLTVHHYSQVQVNMPMMQYMFKRFYNKELETKLAAFSSGDMYGKTCIRPTSKPYIQVKLLPQSNWAMVMKQYIHKGMEAADSRDGNTDCFGQPVVA